ncbi:ABC1 family protein [Rhodothalassium salexigens DSM 2132]|uniref:ABC1 family protein n=1 Tax=Rhodothalassium salexigens DSM 2132 TaxID=1188247 RepID=A0A4R2PQ73_RHOSA|nr:AarF/ABC1/UbiB kinase family protein [Rhodothalassium salexigens]MBB4210500.1 putative unusual protein kinase regulating ubiquinone biosynthesis (AarF/ABC1/UbiB family) [Rhodothalassium salexigens DSM 2132]MBK1639889.1 ABC transporter ATP-binding protein [Rhodothalassium salexigens DSM 2132]TCP37943.1 ABC1 family protein [Rhodothalassium salexigens DSM 2132]
MSDKAYDDRNNLGGRVRRYARVGGSVGGLAARLAGDRLFGMKIDRDDHAMELAQALGNLKGPVMKVAQILSTIPDALPKEYAQELAQLQAAAPSMGWTFVKRRMRTELGEGWRDRFASFDREASAAASLGQVHKATDTAGHALAVKLQYPDMGAAVEADLNQLDWMLSLFRRYDKSVDTSQIREELAERLREELDYALEARHIALYRHMLADEPTVHVPAVYPDLSAGRLLTMEWLDGTPLMRFTDADQETRNTIARNLFRAWYVPFHRYGVIHGDPHLGNYAARDDLSINLLDFGCVRVFPPRFCGGVIDLYKALRDGDEALAVAAYEAWGFHNLSRELVETLNIWASFLYSPLMEDKPRLINPADNPGQYGAETATKVHKKLKELGPVTPPREFVFMDRAALGLGGVFLRLGATLNWHQLFHDIVGDFSVEALAARQNQALAAAGMEGTVDGR